MKSLEGGDYDACLQILKELRDYTRPPDDNEVKQYFHSIEATGRWYWLKVLMFPPLVDLRRWREVFARDRFYLESLYYSASARFISLDFEQIKEAMNDAERLREELLQLIEVSSLPLGRHDELQMLAICLEAQAAARLALELDEKDLNKTLGQIRLRRLLSKQQLKLKSLIRHASPYVRAEAYTAAGLVKRCETRGKLLLLQEEEIGVDQDELDCFEASLRARPTATAYVFLAQAHFDRASQPGGLASHRQQAESLVKYALRLSPQNALALDLNKTLRYH
jgi:hypothetical protein